MVKPATEKRIRRLSKEDISANEIVRQLRREHRGIRRTTALSIIREERGPKHIAIYGKVNGRSKRIEVYGTGKDLYSIMFEGVHHPPKKRILRISAKKLNTIHGRGENLDMHEGWDERPTIKS